MNWVDVLIWLTLALFTWVGFRRGLVRQIFDLAAVVVALVAAYLFSPRLAVFLEQTFSLKQHLQHYFPRGLSAANLSELLLSFISFILVYQMVKLALIFVGGVVGTVASAPVISAINRVGGAGFGLLKGLLLVFVAITIVNLIPLDNMPEVYQTSALVRQLIDISPYLYTRLQRVLTDVWQSLPR